MNPPETHADAVDRATVDAARPAAAVLRWGMLERFVTYVRRMPDGRTDVNDGAELFDGAFCFPLLDAGASFASFGGAVRFAGHHGMLDLIVRAAQPAHQAQEA